MGLTRRVETTVRGHEGRIDNTSSSDQSGYVQFVVPMSQFDDFRNEIEAMVGPKFISIQVSQQNMLPQKQDIEQVQASVEKNISDLQAAKQKAVTAHTNKAASLQSQINQKQARLSAIQNNTDAASQSEAAQIRSDIGTLQSQLSSENASYANTRDSYDQQIKYANTSLTAVKTQDQHLLDSVATVRGTISLQWISYWDIAHLYLPGNWIPGIMVVLAIIAFLYERRLLVFRHF